jgi:hypothetical protein
LSDLEKPDELVAPFMVAEFRTLSDRILQIEKTRTTRVNYFIGIITAVVAGIALAIEFANVKNTIVDILPFVLFSVFFLGLAILRENLVLASQVVFMFRRAGRIRCWFRDKNPNILPYLPWSPGDDTPTFLAEPDHSTFASKDAILWLSNSLSGAAFVLSVRIAYLRLSYLDLTSAYIFCIVFVLIWIAQNIYIGYQSERYEKLGDEKNRIHFPRSSHPKFDFDKRKFPRKIFDWAFGLTPRRADGRGKTPPEGKRREK